jgi:hypothetical protein
LLRPCFLAEIKAACWKLFQESLLNQGQTVADFFWALEFSAPTYHRWQHMYGGMKVKEIFKELELENTRLKQ